MELNFREIEKKWQQYWRNNAIYKVETDPSKPKYYVLDMFPYPSGAGLHVGHPLGYIGSDIVSRYKRLKGFNVLHPMGFDAFGLPAEQYAIQTGRHPADTTAENSARYREQLDNIGFCYDWDRQVNTSDPKYYKWTQWIFLQLFNSWFNKASGKAESIDTLITHFKANGSSGLDAACDVHEGFTSAEWTALSEKEQQQILMNYRLAYQRDASVNWCEALGTVLANDEVKDGLSERGGHPVEKRNMKQWFLRITAYAERLLNDLEQLDWTDSMKDMQRNWIGKSEGAMVRFDLSPDPSPQGRGEEFGNVVNEPQSPYHHASKNVWNALIPKAKEMKANMTPSEKILWEALRGGNHGFKFRRQHIIDQFIVDFVCLGAGLVVEVGGEIHAHQKEHDEGRTAELNRNGFHVIRFTNEEVESNLNSVIDQIISTCKARELDHEEDSIQLINEDAEEYSASPPSPRGEEPGVRTTISETDSLDSIVSPSLNESGAHPPSPRGEGLGVRSTISESDSLDSTVSPSLNESGAHPPSPRGEGLGVRSIEVFTTRPDTIFGVDFITLAPEHELVEKITTQEQRADVESYASAAKNRSERERMADVKRISGVFTGAYAIHPFSGKKIPVWVGDYVLAGYGTGAVMAVPAGDQRDWDFARHFAIPITEIHEGVDISTEAYTSKETRLINSDFLNGLTGYEAMKIAIAEIEKRGLGSGKVNYRLRDAGFSRQRYWGEPFPIVYRDGVASALIESELPLELPVLDDFRPTGKPESPLVKATSWVETPQGRRETDTMPGFAGSSWYFLRYMDPRNDAEFLGKEAEAYWQDVDLYIGGTEHAVGHLLYARFWQKFLYDLGKVSRTEPFRKLINQGMILGRSNFVYRVSGENRYISADLLKQHPELKTTALHVDVNLVQNDVLDIDAVRKWRPEFAEAEFTCNNSGEYVCGVEIEKMSKSKHNVVNPDDIIEQYGADTLRLYEMFLGPLEQFKPWNTNGIEGVYRFFKKLWNLCIDENGNVRLSDDAPTEQELRVLHKTIRKVEEDIERFSFNTSVSTFMICVNELSDLKCSKKAIIRDLLVILSPYAPHIAEELWQACGEKESIVRAAFPQWNEAYIRESSVVYPVAFNGKTRYQIQVPAEMPQQEVQALALAHEEASKWLNGVSPKKVIVVPGRMVNVVV